MLRIEVLKGFLKEKRVKDKIKVKVKKRKVKIPKLL
jgi:hypothetical protein